MKVLLDTNIVVDVLQDREPMNLYGRMIFLAVAKKKINGYLTAKEITDIHFFARKQFKGQENMDAKARQVVAKMMTLFDIIDTTGMDCRQAMGFSNGDYEDAVMMASAERCQMDAIVTRNTKHFSLCNTPVYEPDEFVSQFLNE